MRNGQVRDWCGCEQAALDARVAVLARRATECRIPLPFRCQQHFTALNSAAGRLGKIMSKLMIYIIFSRLRGHISRASGGFSPDVRGNTNWSQPWPDPTARRRGAKFGP